jgi:hypothetical protein
MVLDLPPWEVDKRSLVAVNNLRSYQGALQTLGGRTFTVQTPDKSQPSFIGSAQFQDQSQVGIVATQTNVFGLLGNTLQALLANAINSIGVGTPWEMAELLDNIYLLNPSLGLYVMSEQLADLAFLKASAGTVPNGFTMTDFYNHLIVGNIVGATPPGNLPGSPQSFMGSGAGDATYWNVGNQNEEARSFLIPDRNDPIKCVRKLGDWLIVYKQYSVWIVQYISPNTLIYSPDRVSGATGTPAGQSVVVVQSQSKEQSDQHYYVGQDNIYMFDGSPHAIGTRVWNDFRARVMPSNRGNIIGFYHQLFYEVYWGFASATGNGSIDTALVYDIENDAFYYRDWPFAAGGYALSPQASATWQQENDPWNKNPGEGTQPWVTATGLADLAAYVADTLGNIYQYDNTALSDFPCTATTFIDDCGDDTYVKMCNGLRLDVQGVTGQPLQVWGRGLMELSEYNTKPFLHLNDTSGSSHVRFNLSGRWLQFQFQQAAGGSFQLNSWEPSYKRRGLY